MSKRVRNTVVPFNAQEVTRPAKASTKSLPKPPRNTAPPPMQVNAAAQDANDALLKENAELRAALRANALPPSVGTSVLPPPVLAQVPKFMQIAQMQVAEDLVGDPALQSTPIATAARTTIATEASLALPVLDNRPAVTYTRLPISEIRATTDFTRLALYGRVVEVSPITNKPVQGGHRQLWWIWVVDAVMSIQVSIWSGVGTPRGDPPLIPRVGEVVNVTGFAGVLSNGQWDKWHPCQLQAEHTSLKFTYPGSDAALLWDKQLNPARTVSCPTTPVKKQNTVTHAGYIMEATPRTDSAPPLARLLNVGAPRFCTECGQPLVGGSKHCAESGKLH